MTAAIIFIGTAKYKEFFDGYYEGIIKNFLTNTSKTIFAFTDNPQDPIFAKPNVITKKIEHLQWPFITLYRFKFMRSICDELLKFDNIFFIDADLWAVETITENDLPLDKELIGVQHPGFINKIGTFETDTRSHANIFDGYYDVNSYRQGCFWGGKSEEVVKMIQQLDSLVDDDLKKGIVAVWHDESHMNKYFLLHPNKVHTVNAGFAQPQHGYDHIRQNFPTKFVHLHKEQKEFPRFSGVR